LQKNPLQKAQPGQFYCFFPVFLDQTKVLKKRPSLTRSVISMDFQLLE